MSKLSSYKPTHKLVSPLMYEVLTMLRRDFRVEFGLHMANKWGYFIDRYLSQQIHSFADWMDYPKGDSILQSHTDTVFDAVTSSDGRWLFSCGGDSQIIAWDLSCNKPVFKWTAHDDSAVLSIAYHSGLIASVGKPHSIRVWKARDQTLKMDLSNEGHTKPIRMVKFNSRGNTLVTASDDRSVRVWSLNKRRCIGTFLEHKHIIQYVGFMQDSTTVMSASMTPCIKLWNPLLDEDESHSFRSIEYGISEELRACDLNCDESLFVCLCESGLTVYQWPEMDKVHSMYFLFGFHCRFHPNQPRIIAVNTGFRYVDLLNISEDTSIKVLKSFGGHNAPIFGIHFTPDGTRLITVSSDQSIRIYDISEFDFDYFK